MRRHIRRLSMQDSGDVTSELNSRRRNEDAADTMSNPEVRQEMLSIGSKVRAFWYCLSAPPT